MERIFKKSECEFIRCMRKISDETAEAYVDCLCKPVILKDKNYAMQFLETVFAYNKRKNLSCLKTSILIMDLTDIARTEEIFYMFPRDNPGCAPLLKDFMKCFPERALDQLIFAGMILEYYFRMHEKAHKPKWYTRRVRNSLRKLMAVKGERINEHTKLFTGHASMLPIQIKKVLDEKIIGQDTAKKAMAMAIHRFYHYNDRTPVLLEGPTGSGKTLLFETLASCEELQQKLTFFSYTATQLTPNGYNGDNLEDLFKQYNRAYQRRIINYSCEFPSPKGIIFIDEIDKLLSYSNTDSAGENVNETILHQMLTAVSGTSIAGIDTKNILFVFAGAFENLENRRSKNRARSQMGFTAGTAVFPEKDVTDFENYDLRKELVDLGAPRQFLARIGTFVRLERLGKNELKNIILNEQNGIIPIKRKQLEKDGLQLEIKDDTVIDRMVELAEDNNMGARGIAETVSSLVDQYTFDMLENGYSRIILHEGIFHGEKPYFDKILREGNQANKLL